VRRSHAGEPLFMVQRKTPRRSLGVQELLAGKKAAAGADFIRTQIIYNVEKFANGWRKSGTQSGQEDKILAGVAPIKSIGASTFMSD